MSGIWTSILELGRRDPVALEFLVEGTSWHSQPFGCPFDAAFFFPQYSFDVLTFEFNQCEIRVQVDLRPGSSVKVKVLEADGFLIAEQYRPLDHVAQFPDIAWPRIGLESFETIGTQSHFPTAKIGAKLFKQVFSEYRDIFFAFSERRESQRNGTDSEIQIFSELPLRRNHVLWVAAISVRRPGDHAHLQPAEPLIQGP